MKKRGDLPIENILFLLLDLAFLGIMVVFIVSSTGGRPIYEQSYAKEIAFIIDEAKPDTRIELDISDLAKFAKENDYSLEKVVSIDNKDNRVLVKLGEGRGNSFQFFPDLNIKKSIDSKNKRLILELNDE